MVNNFKRLTLVYTLLFSIISASFPLHAQLTVTTVSTASALVAKLAGPGVTIVSDTLICNTAGSGTFVSVSTSIRLDSGIILCTGRAANTSGTEPSLTSTGFGGSGDPDLSSFIGTATSSRDACELIIHFVPKGDTVSFNYQFGSEEYRQSTCGRYNDGFAFFISGPGISTSLPGVNMALVPGTNIPVAVNTINSGVIGSTAGCAMSNCTAYGTGSPFTSLYIDNTGGTTTTYRGYTQVLTAKHWVTPCDTYRIKMSIVDAGNDLYDSGVFIEAGSLQTNTFKFDRTTVGNTINSTNNSIVKGCPGDSIKVFGDHTSPYPVRLHLTYAGTGVAGVDYLRLPDSLVIPAGSLGASLAVSGIPTAIGGAKTLIAYLTSSSSCGIVDTITINILDRPAFSILTRDTVVCPGTAFTIRTTGTTGLSYNWSPSTFLSSSIVAQPICTPSGNIIYYATATYSGSLCPLMIDSSKVRMADLNVLILTPDTTVCQKDLVQINVSGSNSLNYQWYPATGLVNSTIQNPTAIASVTTTFTLVATYPGTTCATTKNITITVVPTDFEITTRDTFFCSGASIRFNMSVSPAAGTGYSYTYAWTGPNGYSSNLADPVITTGNLSNDGKYTIRVTNQGICAKTATENVKVMPTPGDVIQAPTPVVCQYSPSLPVTIEGYSNLVWYTDWNDNTPTIFAPYVNTSVLGVQEFVVAEIAINTNCIGQKQKVDVLVKECCNGSIFIPDAFTPNEDGLNDYLKVVKSSDYVVNEFVVYDRWGKEVYHSNSDNSAWDGKLNNTPLDGGTYFYYAVVSCVNNGLKNQILKGSSILVR